MATVLAQSEIPWIILDLPAFITSTLSPSANSSVLPPKYPKSFYFSSSAFLSPYYKLPSPFTGTAARVPNWSPCHFVVHSRVSHPGSTTLLLLSTLYWIKFKHLTCAYEILLIWCLLFPILLTSFPITCFPWPSHTSLLIVSWTTCSPFWNTLSGPSYGWLFLSWESQLKCHLI